MRRFLDLIAVVSVLAAATAFVTLSSGQVAGQAAASLNTPWGEPDLQGIWTDEFDTPLERNARYAKREFFTGQERAALDKERAALLGRDRRVERGTELDVAGAYNSVFMSIKRTGTRTSLVVDPPDGRIPALTPQARQMADRKSVV